MRRIIKNLRFFTEVKTSTETQITDASYVYKIDFDKINPDDYKDLDQKVKIRTGYTFLEVEPYPRKKIIELCLICLHKLKPLPETSMFKLYHEERSKYLIELTHETPHIIQLEKKLGYDSIEMFISDLAWEVHLIDEYKHTKLWESTQTSDKDNKLYTLLKTPYDQMIPFEKVNKVVENPRLEKQINK